MSFTPQPLNQTEYSIKIVKDLGNIFNDEGTNRKLL